MVERAIWQSAEALLRAYGDMAEQECNARISYCQMTWNPAGAFLWRQRLEAVTRLRRGEQPPLLLPEAVAAGRFHEFLTEQGANDVAAVLLDEVTAVVRALVRTRLSEMKTSGA